MNSYNTVQPSLWAITNTWYPDTHNISYLETLVNNEKNIITSVHLKKLFSIFSVIESPFERMLKAMNINYNKVRVSTESKIFYWQSCGRDALYGRKSGSDIVSLYSFMNRKTLIESINIIYDYLNENEPNSLLENNQGKPWYKCVKKPLSVPDLPQVYQDILNIFTPQVKTKFNKNMQTIGFTYTLTLANNEEVSFTFSICRHFKSTILCWIPKEIYNATPPSQSSSKASLITPPGQKIPGSDIQRKPILHPLVESGQVVWIYGPEKSFKSRFARILAHSLSYGNTFLDKYKVESSLPVLYISSEDEPDKFEQACEAELKGASLKPERNFYALLAKALENPSGQINLLDPTWQAKIVARIEDIDIIIIDCLYNLIDGKTDIKDFIAFINYLKSKGKTIFIIDHTNRDGDLSGSIDKRRFCDLSIKIEKMEDYKVKVSFPTARHLSPDDTKAFFLNIIADKNTFKFEPCKEEAEKEMPKVTADKKRQMVAYVLKVTHGLKQKNELDNLFNCSDSTLSNWIHAVRKATWQSHEAQQLKKYQEMSKEELIDEAKKLSKR